VKIRSIQAAPERFALTRPYAIAGQAPVTEVENVVVRIETEDGQVGLGAGSPGEHVTGETNESCLSALAPSRLEWLRGRDVRTLRALCRESEERFPLTPAARAAVDIALHDLLGKRAGLPLADLLGRSYDALPTSITIGIKPVPETLAEADEYLGRGFRVLKLKIGDALEDDIERLLRLREHVGRRAVIRVDANIGYSVEDTARFFERSAPLDIEFVEQPVRRESFDLVRGLPAAWRRRIAADESLHGETDALSLAGPIGDPACGIYNIKLMKCGGVWPALRIAAIAETAEVSLMWGCMDESRISIAAALHAAFSSPATRYLDLDGSLDLARDVVTGGFTLEDGVMRTTDAPGLGVSLL
jgi:L-alanine-DL-glutamate epimerase-like enolase superfamily enzyme